MGQEVTVHYAGWLEDGTLFDSSFERGDTASFQLGRVIQGWNEGLQLMKEGAIYKFTIPSELGYGKRGGGDKIPPDSTLIFYVELIKVGK
jgi:FKBP-type peptidyl-prolyl cis-trans isomerase